MARLRSSAVSGDGDAPVFQGVPIILNRGIQTVQRIVSEIQVVAGIQPGVIEEGGEVLYGVVAEAERDDIDESVKGGEVADGVAVEV
jgi:hypothetical protein